MKSKDAITALAALAQDMRLQVFRTLVVGGPQGLTPSALAEQLTVPASTLSFHLKELMHAQLVTQERHGRQLIYRAQYAHMNALISYLTEQCCQGDPCHTTTPCQSS